mmetsp:Transcript_14185/g.27905  ORF Transcript_14185/g.27905 Transcript_14185/m.27905 type:complete len:370 (-) Transcript_14185:153-1262(-)
MPTEDYWAIKKEVYEKGEWDDRYPFFRPIESIEDMTDEEEDAREKAILELVGSDDPETDAYLRKLSAPTEAELKAGAPSNPGLAYTDLDKKLYGDMASTYMPLWYPHAIPRQDWEVFLPDVDDIEADLASWQAEQEEAKQMNPERDEEIEKITVSVSPGSAQGRHKFNRETGRDETPFMQLAFARTGLAYLCAAGGGAMLGSFTTFRRYYGDLAVDRGLLRTMMLNSSLYYAPRWGERWAILAFMYTANYTLIRDYVQEKKYFKEDQHAQEVNAICTAAGAATGAMYSISGKNWRFMFVHALIGGATCWAGSCPIRIPGLSDFVDTVRSKIARPPQSMIKPIGMERSKEEEARSTQTGFTRLRNPSTSS